MAQKAVKRVLFVIGNLSGGGAERVISILSNALAERGVDVKIACIGRQATPVEYPIHPHVSVAHLSSANGGMTGKARQIRALRECAKMFCPDVAVAFMSYIAVQAIAALLFTGIPVVYCIRNVLENDLCDRGVRLASRLLYPLAAGAVYQLPGQQSGFRPARNRKEIILMNPAEENPLWKQKRPSHQKIVIAAGRLTKAKNYPLLINAFAKLPDRHGDCVLEILGKGELRDTLQKMARDMGLAERVLFSGFVGDAADRINRSAVYVLSSDYEGLPNALIEAMCLGVPCITTNFTGGGAALLVQDGINGLIVPTNDADALAAAITKLLDDPDMANRLGERAKDIREKVNVTAITDQWLAFLAQVADRG